MLMRGFPVYTGVKITFSMLKRKGGFRAELQYANLRLEIEVSTTIIIRGHVRGCIVGKISGVGCHLKRGLVPSRECV